MNFCSYIVSAFKTLPARGRRNGLKVLSLAFGLAVGLTLVSKVCFEQTYDDFYRTPDRIYCLYEAAEVNGKYTVYHHTSGGIAPRMKEYFPGVEAATRFTWFEDESQLLLTDSNLRIEGGQACLADSSLFLVLDRPCLAGDIVDALAVKGNALVSRSVAMKIASSLEGGKLSGFDKRAVAEKAVGQRFTFAGYAGGEPLTVAGVYDDFPLNSSFRPDIVVSMPTIGDYIWDGSDNIVGNDRYSSFLRLASPDARAEIERGIDGFIQTYLPVEELKAAGYDLGFVLKPYLAYHNEDENQRKMTLVLAFVAFALLLTSTLNYLLIVLSSAVARSREMALRKCLGSGRGDIFAMMAAESLVHTLLASALAAALIFAFRGTIETLLGADVASLFSGRPLAVALFVLAVLFAINAVVPTIAFNRIPVAAAFRNFVEGKRRWKLALLSVEFAAVGFLAVVIGIISLQYERMTRADLGFNYENLAMLSFPEASFEQRNRLMTEVRSLSAVEDAAFACQNPFEGYSGDNVSVPGEERQLFNVRDAYYVDSHWVNVMGIELLSGSNFDPSLGYDREALVDERFVEKMQLMAGWDETLGREVNITAHNGPTRICGVFKTISQGSFLKDDAQFADRPMAVFFCDPLQYAGTFHYIFVKYHRLTPEALKATTEIMEKELAGQAYKVSSCRAVALENFRSTVNTRNSVVIGGVMTLLIALLGLIGYTIDEARRRSKEIAVRRVNGAQFSEIRAMFLRDVMKIAVPSVAVGCILAGIVSHRWEQQFTLQVGLPWWIFALAVVGELGIIAAVSDFYVRRIANRNPAESIKTE